MVRICQNIPTIFWSVWKPTPWCDLRFHSWRPPSQDSADQCHAWNASVSSLFCQSSPSTALTCSDMLWPVSHFILVQLCQKTPNTMLWWGWKFVRTKQHETILDMLTEQLSKFFKWTKSNKPSSQGLVPQHLQVAVPAVPRSGWWVCGEDNWKFTAPVASWRSMEQYGAGRLETCWDHHVDFICLTIEYLT